MLSNLISRPCTLLLRSEDGDTDNHGNEIPSEEAVETVCELQQGTGQSTGARSEPPSLEETSDTRWTVFLPAGTAIDTGDAIVVDGRVFELIGDPWPVRNPRTGAESHVEATVRRVAGAEETGS